MLHYFSDESSAHYHIITGLMFAAWKLEFAMEDSEAWSKMEASSSKPVSKTLRERGGGGTAWKQFFSSLGSLQLA